MNLTGRIMIVYLTAPSLQANARRTDSVPSSTTAMDMYLKTQTAE
jgi:hypothetical protein